MDKVARIFGGKGANASSPFTPFRAGFLAFAI